MQKYFPLIWMDKIFFTAGHSQKRTTSKRAGLSSQTSAGSRMEQNEWTVRTFPAYRLLPSEKLKVQWLVRITDRVLIMQVWFPKVSPPISRQDVWRSLWVDGWQTLYGWPLLSSEIREIHQVLRGSRELSVSVQESSVTYSPLPACSLSATTPERDWNTHFISFRAQLSEADFTNTTTSVLWFIDTFQLFFWLPYFSLDLYVSIICKLNINL